MLRRYKFSLPTIFVVMTALCIVFALHVWLRDHRFARLFFVALYVSIPLGIDTARHIHDPEPECDNVRPGFLLTIVLAAIGFIVCLLWEGILGDGRDEVGYATILPFALGFLASMTSMCALKHVHTKIFPVKRNE